MLRTFRAIHASSRVAENCCRAIDDFCSSLGARRWRDASVSLASSCQGLGTHTFSTTIVAPREPTGGASPDEPAGHDAAKVAKIGGKRLRFEAGRLSPLSAGSCLAQVGGTQVLATVEVVGKDQHVHRRQHFSLPLQVEYRQRPSATGKAVSGYQRREIPSEQEVLAAVYIKQALAPHFPPGFLRGLQVSAAVLSADGGIDPLVLAINAASAALMCSPVPWAGPVAAVKVARLAGKLVVNPSAQEEARSDMSLLYAGTKDETVMLDLQAKQVLEEAVIKAVNLAHSQAGKALVPQSQLAASVGRRKFKCKTAGADPAAAERVSDIGRAAAQAALQGFSLSGSDGQATLAEAKEALLDKLRANGFFRIDQLRVPGSGCVSSVDLDHAWNGLIKETVRDMVFGNNLRPDGRGMIDIRPVHEEEGLLIVPHGSSLLTAGATQVLSTITISAGGRILETASPDRPSPCIVHYMAPSAPNLGGERVQRSPSMAEQSAGLFIERALEQVLPAATRFPFGLRANVDVLAEDGSPAEHALTACSRALKSTNVPMLGQVAGVSIGLITDASGTQLAGSTEECSAEEVQRFVPPFTRWELLTDTQGIEEQVCDMRLSTAGARDGLVALQLECSIPGVPTKLIAAALDRAKAARLKLLDGQAAGGQTREEPQIGSFEIAKEHIARVIGPNGSVLRGVEESTGVRLTIRDDGKLHYFAPSQQQATDAENAIASITGADIKEGGVYSVKVVRLMDYGAFVELPNSFQALLHISELSHSKVRSVEDVLTVGQQLDVLCQGRDSRGFLRLSLKALQDDSS